MLIIITTVATLGSIRFKCHLFSVILIIFRWITGLGQVLWKISFLLPQSELTKCLTFLRGDQWQEAMGKTQIRENFFKQNKRLFAVRVVKLWSRVSREVVWFPSLEITKHNWARSWAICFSFLYFNKEVGLYVFQRCLPVSSILRFYRTVE